MKLNSEPYNKLNNLVIPTYSSEPSFVTLKNTKFPCSCYKGIYGEQRYSSTHSYGGKWLISHPGYFILRNEPQNPLDRNLGVPQSWSGRCGTVKNLPPLPGSNPRQSSPQPLYQSFYYDSFVSLKAGEMNGKQGCRAKPKIYKLLQLHQSYWLAMVRTEQEILDIQLEIFKY
jgi:hypothetical protein